jgi:hypothetical protein
MGLIFSLHAHFGEHIRGGRNFNRFLRARRLLRRGGTMRREEILFCDEPRNSAYLMSKVKRILSSFSAI